MLQQIHLIYKISIFGFRQIPNHCICIDKSAIQMFTILCINDLRNPYQHILSLINIFIPCLQMGRAETGKKRAACLRSSCHLTPDLK